ncbi:MAG: HAMP domain-containing histidine kinase [Phycisphaerales bacterium]|nr:HAMP domain-containing histidine kinase [Hyphomonadaceae bacterium]
MTAVINLNDTSTAAREALRESLAISRGGQVTRLIVVFIGALPAVALLGAPVLLIWLAAMLTWDGLIVRQIERRWVVPAIESDLRSARLLRASMVLFGLGLSQVLPFTGWIMGGASGAAVAAAWALCAATQVFVFYSRDRLLLVAGIAPVVLCAILGPALGAGLSWESTAVTVFMLFAIAAGGAFVGRADALIARAAGEAAARHSAEASSLAKSRFIANMHHELRTPLNAIIGYTEMMREAAEEDGRNADIADLNRVLAAARMQLVMMSDLLAFAELQDGRSQLEPRMFDAAALVAAAADALRAGAETNGNALKLELGGDLGVCSDEQKVRHCVDHLLANACKFTRDGEIVIRASRERTARADWLVICIADTGVGIAPERMDSIFEPFTQVDDSMTRAADGAGVGLAITLRTARLLGGVVTVESTPGRGSTFTLRVPADLGVNLAIARPGAEAAA